MVLPGGSLGRGLGLGRFLLGLGQLIAQTIGFLLGRRFGARAVLRLGLGSQSFVGLGVGAHLGRCLLRLGQLFAQAVGFSLRGRFGARTLLRLGLHQRALLGLGVGAHLGGFALGLRELAPQAFGFHPRRGLGARLLLGLGLGGGALLGFLAQLGFHVALGFAAAVGLGLGGGDGRPQPRHDLEHDVAALGFDAIVRGLAQGQHDTGARTGALVLGDAGGNQPHRVGAGIQGHTHVAQARTGELDHDAGGLFQLPGREGGPGRGGDDDGGVSGGFGNSDAAHAHRLGRGGKGEARDGRGRRQGGPELGSFGWTGH